MSAEFLFGNWKLVSWQVVTGDEARDLFGSKPKGYLILTREGRATADLPRKSIPFRHFRE